MLIRAVARGPSAMLMMSTPLATSSRTLPMTASGSVPVGEVSSTDTANSPAASRAPSRLRFAIGTTAGRGPVAGFCGCALSSRGGASLAPIIRTAPSMARTCAGVVPQQPPTRVTPDLSIRRAKTPKCSGFAT